MNYISDEIPQYFLTTKKTPPQPLFCTSYYQILHIHPVWKEKWANIIYLDQNGTEKLSTLQLCKPANPFSQNSLKIMYFLN